MRLTEKTSQRTRYSAHQKECDSMGEERDWESEAVAGLSVDG